MTGKVWNCQVSVVCMEQTPNRRCVIIIEFKEIIFSSWKTSKWQSMRCYRSRFSTIMYESYILCSCQLICRVCFLIQFMMTSLNWNIFRVSGHLCREFTGHGWIPAQRPSTRMFDVFFDLRWNKWLSKQSWGWWFETLSRPLWRHKRVSHIFPLCYFNI